MENINDLLTDLLKELYNIEAEKEEESPIDTNKDFNIFTVLHKEHDEVRLHSRFLSVLLSPKSSHKKGNLFLDLFLQTVGIENFDIDVDSVRVFPTEKYKSEYKNIDILIRNNNSKQAIIIENKIFAGDQSKQLERYFDIILKEGFSKENITVLYLTLNKRKPSNASLGKLEKEVKSISYGVEICKWLDKCLETADNQKFLKESIEQYKNLIIKMAGDIKKQLEIRDLIARSEENMTGAKLLVDNFKHIK
jgi:hypothetical protein